MEEVARRKLSLAMKASWRRRQNSERAKRAWATRRSLARAGKAYARVADAAGRNVPVPTDSNGTNALTHSVKYVPDDEITSAVEVLRRVTPADELLDALRDMVHTQVARQLGMIDEELRS